MSEFIIKNIVNRILGIGLGLFFIFWIIIFGVSLRLQSDTMIIASSIWGAASYIVFHYWVLK